MPILSIIDDGFYKRFRITVSFALYTKHIRSIYAVLMARWPAFSTAQHYRDHGADRLHQKNRKRKCFVLRINGKNILDWFRKQFERLLQQYSNHNEKTRNSNCNDYKYLCANIKNAGNVIALPTFFIFLHLERGSSLQDILEFEEALCLSCGWEPRKFTIVHKDSIVVLTHIAWAAIPISVYKVFLGPPTRTWHAVSRFYVEWPPERLREVNLFEIVMNVRYLLILCGTFLLFMACKDSPKQKSPSFSKNPNHSYVIAIKSDISVKKEPVEGKLVGFIERGEICELVDSVNGWYKVRLRTGEKGYVNSEFSKVLSHDSIPKEAFESYCPLAEPRVQYGDLSFRVDGNNVFMARAYNSVPEDGDLWKSVYQGATIYYGKIEGNRLVFTRSLSRFDLTLDSLAPSELEEIEPYTAYYSPVERGFIFEGALFKAVDLDEDLNTVSVNEDTGVPHPLSARKGLCIYVNVESVADSEGKFIRFDKVGNILEISEGNESSTTYSYNTERTKYNRSNWGSYIITYSDHKRSDMSSDESDMEGSVEYLFDEQDRIIERKNQVKMIYLTEKFTYTGANLLPDSKSVHDYDETGDYLTTDRYEYLEADEHGNWLKRKVIRTNQVKEYKENGESFSIKTEPERIETQSLKYFNN